MRRLVLVWVFVLVTACSSGSMSPEMQAVAEDYFKAMRSGNINRALELYDADFYAQTPRQRWQKILVRVSEKLGKIQAHKLLGWRVHSRVGTDAGLFLELTYEVEYEKYPAQEFIVVRRPLTGGAPKILGHTINSQGLLLE